jgi:RNA 3'-terminal phosphate cyclase (ATP)
MIEIDGSVHSGSGTLLRYAVALATLIGEPLHMIRIRSNRRQPGLRPQHLQAVQACTDFSGGELEGAAVGETEITYRPGKRLRGGEFRWEIGTAGSTTMLAFTLVPLALFAESPSRFAISGGLFQDFAPSAFHMQHTLLPLIRRMGGEARLEVVRPGYVPQGRGEIVLDVKPLERPLGRISLLDQGEIKEIWGISFASHLAEQRVAERMADECSSLILKENMTARFQIENDTRAVQKGAALFLRAETETGCLLGADQAGKPGRRSEAIARFVVRSLLEDLRSRATTDRHLADQLILFSALAEGRSEYRIPATTDHVSSNLWLVREVLGVASDVQDKVLNVEGSGFFRRRRESDHALHG